MILYSRIFGKKHEAQVTVKTALAQTSNTNKQQFANKDSNSTFNTAQLLTAYQLALQKTLQREIPKACSHSKGDRSRLTGIQSPKTTQHLHDPSKALFIVSPTGRYVTWNRLEKSVFRLLFEVSRKF
ncbi:hypothetical protein AVEN_105914-1 [Araneus ventricosus]|uniref:Uncharacterized protein n=1 Tax=Araneus ventricosus TaxID=182803 RepID=A0A4Y2QVU3_ARAVE|nr:hypothetical protein AVEN_105914-1 [Araneus ventricosus]